ncbi:MAG: sulfate adenylyltransferase subunit CysN [Rhodoblastus sp.]|nr:sulfate adenylyltransferase subunit CysN [Rhodoblastus sp.]
MGAQLKLVETNAPEPILMDDFASVASGVAAERSLLRFLTCGSVDDGKSTLLGRLLYETGAVFDDQLQALERDSARFGTTGDDMDYALLVDGLAAEREQGITIDVAYRYFSTAKRAFIAADTPGHEQYTRNMATGASTADVAIILVDARKGLLAQTRRHSYIVSMLGVRRVIVAVNKIDLVGYDENVFRRIEQEYRKLAGALEFLECHVVPVSARHGDNVVTSSDKTPWYGRAPLLALLENIETVLQSDEVFRFPVQWVNRPHLDFRGFSGTIASGSIAVGDRITTLPRGRSSRVARILGPSGDLDVATSGQSITLTLADEIDISRGDVLVAASASAAPQRHIVARLLAMNEAQLAPGRNYLVKIGTNLASARLVTLHHQVDVHDYSEQPASVLPMNGIGLATLRFETDVVAPPYRACQTLGALLLIDPHSNETIGLGVVEDSDVDADAVTPSWSVWLASGLAGIGALPAEDGASELAWLAVSAIVTAFIALALSGSVVIAVMVGIADFFFRPALRVAFRSAWAAASKRRALVREAELTTDGGGI